MAAKRHDVKASTPEEVRAALIAMLKDATSKVKAATGAPLEFSRTDLLTVAARDVEVPDGLTNPTPTQDSETDRRDRDTNLVPLFVGPL